MLTAYQSSLMLLAHKLRYHVASYCLRKSFVKVTEFKAVYRQLISAAEVHFYNYPDVAMKCSLLYSSKKCLRYQKD